MTVIFLGFAVAIILFGFAVAIAMTAAMTIATLEFVELGINGFFGLLFLGKEPGRQ